jgi:hypothetical protein
VAGSLTFYKSWFFEIYRLPEGEGFTEMFVLEKEEEISAAAFPDKTFQVSELIR